eukprot:134088_1
MAPFLAVIVIELVPVFVTPDAIVVVTDVLSAAALTILGIDSNNNIRTIAMDVADVEIHFTLLLGLLVMIVDNSLSPHLPPVIVDADTFRMHCSQ